MQILSLPNRIVNCTNLGHHFRCGSSSLDRRRYLLHRAQVSYSPLFSPPETRNTNNVLLLMLKAKQNVGEKRGDLLVRVSRDETGDWQAGRRLKSHATDLLNVVVRTRKRRRLGEGGCQE